MIIQERLKELVFYDKEIGCMYILDTTVKKKIFLNQGYYWVTLDKKQYLVHRLVWLYIYGEFPKHMIDHINGDGSDNRLCNLREATPLENQRNHGISKSNTSGFRGVYFYRNKWRARCRLQGSRKYIGSFNTAIEASEAYEEFTKESYGEFYRSV